MSYHPDDTTKFVCPLCNFPDCTAEKCSEGNSLMLWQSGIIPECFCGVMHDSRINYDACTERPAQCEYCLVVMPTAELDDHTEKCIKNMPEKRRCINKDCNVIVDDRTKSAHEKICMHRTIMCLKCKSEMKYFEFEGHMNSVCTKRGSKCEACALLRTHIKGINVPTHKASADCPHLRLIHRALTKPEEMKVVYHAVSAEAEARLAYSEIS